MNYETGFELRCHLDSIQELIANDAKSIIISVSYTETGERKVEMFGEIDKTGALESLDRISPSSSGACPMPCPRRPVTDAS